MLARFFTTLSGHLRNCCPESAYRAFSRRRFFIVNTRSSEASSMALFSPTIGNFFTAAAGNKQRIWFCLRLATPWGWGLFRQNNIFSLFRAPFDVFFFPHLIALVMLVTPKKPRLNPRKRENHISTLTKLQSSAACHRPSDLKILISSFFLREAFQFHNYGPQQLVFTIGPQFKP